MNRRIYALLFLLSLIVISTVAFFQGAPGTMDEDYYFAGGIRLAQGHGFTETYLWNYLDNPQSLPHPSHGYWFPLASIIAAAGILLAGQQTFLAARLGFILIAALVPPVTASLAYTFSSRRDVALVAGLLAVFPTYQIVFLPTTENFGLFMLLGGLFFILFNRPDKKSIFALGLVAGLMNLSRSDGLLWLAVGLLGLGIKHLTAPPSRSLRITHYALLALIFLLGYALPMAPWIARNLTVFGAPLTPGGSRVLWMTSYNDTFAYPPDRVNLQTWLAAGWQPALSVRWDAFKLNFANTIAVQGGILLLPFILIGIWASRKDLRVWLAALVWLGLFAIMTLVLPFAGSRGAFLHAGAAFQPLWWAVAPLGLDFLVGKIRRRGWLNARAPQFFRAMLVMVMAVLTICLVYVRVVQTDWAAFDRSYRHAEQILLQNGASAGDAVVVGNAPGYFVVSGRSAVTVPTENPAILRVLSQRFNAHYLVLEKQYMPDSFKPVYDFPQQQPGLKYLGGFDDVRIFAIQPEN
ncbi:MAG: hypothetical protein WA821_08390 [Anaerolineales bacterium]